MAIDNNEQDGQEERRFFWRLDGWGAPIVGVLIVLILLVGISVSQAEPTTTSTEACSGDDCGDERQSRWGHKRGGHRFFGHRGHHGDRHDPERAKEHMQYATGWMLKRLDVEDDVEEQIQARLETAFDALVPVATAHKDSRDDWIQAMLGSERVDRDALAAQREATLTAATEAMQIVTDALADVADMLTPEQRAEIAEKIQRHHH